MNKHLVPYSDDYFDFIVKTFSCLYYPGTYEEFISEGDNHLETKMFKCQLFLLYYSGKLVFHNNGEAKDPNVFLTNIFLGNCENNDNSIRNVHREFIKMGLAIKENVDFTDISIEEYYEALDEAIAQNEISLILQTLNKKHLHLVVSDIYKTMIVPGTRNLLLTLKKKIRISPSDQFYEGMKYLLGKGVDKDLNMAVYWLNESVKQNYPQAFGMLARCYLNGQGVEADRQKGLELLEKGARLDDKESICLLGVRCFDEKDYPRALELLERVKDTHPVAQYIIGDCYLTGTYYDMDEVKGLEYIKKAADKGFKIAVEKLKALEIKNNPEKYENIDPDAVCPCGSGLKFKYCHGAKK
jgi:hypothetical protein